ncbi:hypothetical protein FDP41_007342 [Naegleria fowleri]|uniref:Uncharacterized protein n=2 Tax=Naegleria fowleri TaxID=5763 RepID=A0A6A5CFX2_NAEFO|nr:uncharacterized protein FDP41_007342 [Naegleria fowleri]KAF0984165.1 hypothetical protein FDP41_007342 [Naegleria fowleri]
MIDSTKEMVETAKKIQIAFSKPTDFKRERVCVNVNVKHEKICTVDPSMLNFIRKQGALDKTEPNIPIQVFAGPVPLNFAFYATVGVDISYELCANRISASVSLEPFVAISLGGRAGIGVAALSAGVFMEATITYKFIPRIAVENCNINASTFRHKLAQICIPIGGNSSGRPIVQVLPSFSSRRSFRNVSLPRDRQIEFHRPKDPKPPKRNNQQGHHEFKRPLAPKGYRLPFSQVAKIWKRLPVIPTFKLKRIARKDGYKNWAKKITIYRNQFGPGA